MERRAIHVRGVVQGVGFRPFVYTLASQLNLGGFVRNVSGSVLIEVEGEPPTLDAFVQEITDHPPRLAQVEDISCRQLPTRGNRRFRILASGKSASPEVAISPDVATCPDCLAELFDPLDRRHGYPFLNCTNCGPRLTIITGAPYDRPQTTMAGFPLCPACQAEYDDPGDRRFHAQPIACPVCGPRLSLCDAGGRPVEIDDPVAAVAAALAAGQIAAIKGLGGYHLAADATNQRTVERLRARKGREQKPLALMVRDASAAAAWCHVSAAERRLLESPQAPIVLLLKRKQSPSTLEASTGHIAEAVAPGDPLLGVMLPHSPLHHVLLAALGGRPIVMTSGNRTDEPIAYHDADARERLGPIADCVLSHNRPIHIRCDDSVVRVVDGVELPLRRSRGYAPQPVSIPLACPQPILATGGQLKATFGFGRGRQAILSHHLGDLDHFEALRSFQHDIRHYERLLEIEPAAIVHDLHPDYASTQYAIERAAADGLASLAVQHHHAHLASCLADNDVDEPVIGVVFDGTGYGEDGAIWGGEFLVGDYRGVTRGAHLRYVCAPGGDQAARQPWRMAASHLLDAGCGLDLVAARQPASAVRTIERMIERRVNAPLTSSVGRLFDAVASLTGLRDQVSYEGQAAIECEWLATGVAPDGNYPFGISKATAARASDPSPPLVVDTRPLIQAVAADVRRGVKGSTIARRFHGTLAEMVVAVCEQLRLKTGLKAVALSGGTFANAILTHDVCQALRTRAFRFYRHRRVPPGDGGLSLGQIAIAAARLGPRVASESNTAWGTADVPRNTR